MDDLFGNKEFYTMEEMKAMSSDYIANHWDKVRDSLARINNKDTTESTYTPTSDYTQYCFNRIPCGICQRTGNICPLVSNSNSYDITCKSIYSYGNDTSKAIL